MQVPYFQLLLFPALLQTCYLLFACFASCKSACSPAIIKSAAAALIFFVLFRWFWICSCLVSLQNVSSPDSLPALPLVKFRLSCTAILTFTAGFGFALLIAAVDLSPGFLQLSVKIFLLKGKERIDKRLTGSGLAWGRGASQIVYGHSFKPLSHS